MKPPPARIEDDCPALRTALIAHARRMAPAQLNRGSAGNLSVRALHAGQSGYLITPTGMAYADLAPDDLVFMGLDGHLHGARKPSSEWRFHHDVYAARPEAGAMMAASGSDNAARTHACDSAPGTLAGLGSCPMSVPPRRSVARALVPDAARPS